MLHVGRRWREWNLAVASVWLLNAMRKAEEMHGNAAPALDPKEQPSTVIVMGYIDSRDSVSPPY